MLFYQLVEKKEPLKSLPNSCTLFAQQANFLTRNLALNTYSQLESIMNLNSSNQFSAKKNGLLSKI